MQNRQQSNERPLQLTKYLTQYISKTQQLLNQYPTIGPQQVANILSFEKCAINSQIAQRVKLTDLTHRQSVPQYKSNSSGFHSENDHPIFKTKQKFKNDRNKPLRPKSMLWKTVGHNIQNLKVGYQSIQESIDKIMDSTEDNRQLGCEIKFNNENRLKGLQYLDKVRRLYEESLLEEQDDSGNEGDLQDSESEQFEAEEKPINMMKTAKKRQSSSSNTCKSIINPKSKLQISLKFVNDAPKKRRKYKRVKMYIKDQHCTSELESQPISNNSPILYRQQARIY